MVDGTADTWRSTASRAPISTSVMSGCSMIKSRRKSACLSSFPPPFDPCLNDEAAHIDALVAIIGANLSGWVKPTDQLVVC